MLPGQLLSKPRELPGLIRLWLTNASESPVFPRSLKTGRLSAVFVGAVWRLRHAGTFRRNCRKGKPVIGMGFQKSRKLLSEVVPAFRPWITRKMRVTPSRGQVG